jgi:hypothetical protein
MRIDVAFLRRPASCVVGVSLALLLSACGGGDGGGEDKATGAASSGASADNHSPTISGRAIATVSAGSAYTFQPQASDQDGDRVTFTIANMPPWAVFDATTGKLSGTPTDAQVGAYAAIEIAATDGTNVATLPNFTITVSPKMAPPLTNGNVSISWDPPSENSDGTPLVDLRGYKIHYGPESRSYEKVVSIDNPGITRYVVDALPAGKYFFALTAFNSKGVESSLSSELAATLN